MELPQAIYFDTNALRQAGEFLDKGAMPRVLAQAQDSDIPLHVPQLVWGERMADLEARLRTRIGSARELNRSVADELIPLTKLDESTLIESMREVQETGFRNLGFSRISNAHQQLDTLITRAINKVAPFHGDDKGFKDTIILDSVTAHAFGTYQTGNVLLVTSDSKLREGANNLADQCPKIDVMDLKDVPDRLAQCCDDVVKASLQQEVQIARDLLEANFQLIADHVRNKKIPAPSVPPRLMASVLDSIKCIQEVCPISISWVSPTQHFSANDSIGQYIDIDFGVSVDFVVVLRRHDYHVPVCAPGTGPHDWEYENPGLGTCMEVTDTIRDTVTIYATARIASKSHLDQLHLLSDEEYFNSRLKDFMPSDNSP